MGNDERQAGFTLIEVLVALAIAAIAVVGLMQLHLLSLSAVAKANAEVQAIAIAQERIAEMEAKGPLQTGSQAGSVERNRVAFRWQTQVSDLAAAGAGPLRRVVVTVCWDQGPRARDIVLSTVLANQRPTVSAK